MKMGGITEKELYWMYFMRELNLRNIIKGYRERFKRKSMLKSRRKLVEFEKGVSGLEDHLGGASTDRLKHIVRVDSPSRYKTTKIRLGLHLLFGLYKKDCANMYAAGRVLYERETDEEKRHFYKMFLPALTIGEEMEIIEERKGVEIDKLAGEA